MAKEPHLQFVLDEAHMNSEPAVVSAATLVEVIHPKINRAAFRWTMSRVRVEPVTREIAEAAAGLLNQVGLHGHTNAIDAIVAATALALPGWATIFTSDPDDLRRLVGNRATVVPLC